MVVGLRTCASTCSVMVHAMENGCLLSTLITRSVVQLSPSVFVFNSRERLFGPSSIYGEGRAEVTLPTLFGDSPLTLLWTLCVALLLAL